MKEPIASGNHVAWQWGQGLAQGVVEEVCTGPTTITTKGKTISRNGSKSDPALIITSSKGVKVLKLSHEVQRTDVDGE